MEIRRLLEVPTICRIAETVTAEDLVSLRDMAKQILGHARKGDLRSFVEIDDRFHRHLTGLYGNPMLTELVEDLRSRARDHAIPYVDRHGLLVTAAEEHIRLLDAMQAREMDEVVLITNMHMRWGLLAKA